MPGMASTVVPLNVVPKFGGVATVRGSQVVEAALHPRSWPLVGAVVATGRFCKPVTVTADGVPLTSPASCCQMGLTPSVVRNAPALLVSLGTRLVCGMAAPSRDQVLVTEQP